jgi:hypothetical protein
MEITMKRTLIALLTAASILAMGAVYAADEMAKPEEPAKAEAAKPAKPAKKHHVVKHHAKKHHVVKHHAKKHHAVKHPAKKVKKEEMKKDEGTMAPAPTPAPEAPAQ